MSQETDDARFLELLAAKQDNTRAQQRLDAIAYVLRMKDDAPARKVLVFDTNFLRLLADEYPGPDGDRLRSIAYGIDGQA